VPPRSHMAAGPPAVRLVFDERMADSWLQYFSQAVRFGTAASRMVCTRQSCSLSLMRIALAVSVRPPHMSSPPAFTKEGQLPKVRGAQSREPRTLPSGAVGQEARLTWPRLWSPPVEPACGARLWNHLLDEFPSHGLVALRIRAALRRLNGLADQRGGDR